MTDPAENYRKLIEEVRAIERDCGREAGSVQILAVSKRQPVRAIELLARAGQQRFGENYLQEAVEKIERLADRDLEWHFIGQIQSNKTATVASLFDWVHTLDREKIARRLSAQRDPARDPLNVCIQVNISGEATKGGIRPAELKDFAAVVADLPRLRLRGLMALPAPQTEFEAQRDAFRRLRELYREALGEPVDTLSMGTSADYRAAIFEGATMVRIGTTLFGARH